MINIGKKETIYFLKEDPTTVIFEKATLAELFPSDHSLSKMVQAAFFGNVTRAFREFCFELKEKLFISHQYGFLFALLGYWWDFESKLFEYANQVSDVFEKFSMKKPGQPYGIVKNRVYSQIIRYGFSNWKEIVMGEKIIKAELLTVVEKMETTEQNEPYFNNELLAQMRGLFDKMGERVTTEKDHMNLRILSAYFRLLHRSLDDTSSELSKTVYDTLILVESLSLYLRVSPSCFFETKNIVILLIDDLISKVLKSSPSKTNKYPPLFNNYGYFEIMTMIFRCDPDSYSKVYTQRHIRIMEEYLKLSKINIQLLPQDRILEFYRNSIYPMFLICEDVVKEHIEVHRSFCLSFCERLFPPRLIENPVSLFSSSISMIECVWRMTHVKPQYLLILSNAFVNYFKPRLSEVVITMNVEGITELVSTINHLVEIVFDFDPIMTLARSSLYIPFQSDLQLISRSRGLIEKAHLPIEMQMSVAELFGIVPHIKGKQQFFGNVKDFFQTHLLTQNHIDFSLEEKIIDRIAQYTEGEFIHPINRMLKEFRNSNQFYETNKHNFPHLNYLTKISLLSYTMWKSIVSKGVLKEHDVFSPMKIAFERVFRETHPKEKLIWCDPSSLIEIRMKLKSQIHEQLFLLNGVQFSIVWHLSSGEKSYSYLRKEIKNEDFDDQLQTLIECRLVSRSESNGESVSYCLSDSIDYNIHRNFAHRHKSAESMALKQMKHFDMKQSVSCAICRILKNHQSGMTTDDVHQLVFDELSHIFPVTKEATILQIRELELTSFIQYKTDTNKFFYKP